jgi:hypothetical protein
MITTTIALSALLLGGYAHQEAPARQETKPQEAQPQETKPPQEAREAQETKENKGEDKLDLSKNWDEIIMVPDSVDVIKEKALPFIPENALPLGFHGGGAAPDYFGMRTFCVTVKPKQTVRATLKATPASRYILNYRSPRAEDPMLTKIREAIRTQNARRMPFIELKNTTGELYPFVFFLIGYEDNEYSITLKRSK